MKRSRHRPRAFTPAELEARVATIMAFAHPVGAEQRAESHAEAPERLYAAGDTLALPIGPPGQAGPAERPSRGTRWDA
jgi:hypothetical protein